METVCFVACLSTGFHLGLCSSRTSVGIFEIRLFSLQRSKTQARETKTMEPIKKDVFGDIEIA